MKKFLFSLIALSFVASSFASGTIVVPSSKKPAGIKAAEMMLPIGKNGTKISLQDLSQIKLKDYQQLTGKKMKLMDKISFKLMQKELKHNINADGYFVTKKMDNLAKGKKAASDKAHQYLRMWILFLIIAIVLGIIGIFVPFVWILSGLAWLAAVIFFIVWLVNLSGGM